jgi:hypothetical protein
LAELPEEYAPEQVVGETAEGRLMWCAAADVISGSDAYANNVPDFLAPMLAGTAPAEFFCDYHGGDYFGVTVHPLPTDFARLSGAIGTRDEVADA